MSPTLLVMDTIIWNGHPITIEDLANTTVLVAQQPIKHQVLRKQALDPCFSWSERQVPCNKHANKPAITTICVSVEGPALTWVVDPVGRRVGPTTYIVQ